jgi:glutamate formiminotransferase
MVDYANDLFGAMQEIVQATISKINFDRTDIYTIVEKVENKENWYKVTNG